MSNNNATSTPSTKPTIISHVTSSRGALRVLIKLPDLASDNFDNILKAIIEDTPLPKFSSQNKIKKHDNISLTKLNIAIKTCKFGQTNEDNWHSEWEKYNITIVLILLPNMKCLPIFF